jgi:hypothetical protein
MLGSTLMLHAAKDRQHGGPQRKGEMTNIHYFCDIQGRQISNPRHGLYIKNGKVMHKK